MKTEVQVYNSHPYFHSMNEWYARPNCEFNLDVDTERDAHWCAVISRSLITCILLMLPAAATMTAVMIYWLISSHCLLVSL